MLLYNCRDMGFNVWVRELCTVPNLFKNSMKQISDTSNSSLEIHEENPSLNEGKVLKDEVKQGEEFCSESQEENSPVSNSGEVMLESMELMENPNPKKLREKEEPLDIDFIGEAKSLVLEGE